LPVIYDSNKIIPSPLVDIEKTYQNAANGKKTGAVYQITLSSKLVAFKGSPNSSGAFWNLSGYPPDETVIPDLRLKSLLRKEKAIRDLFSTDGKLLEIQPWDGSAATKFNVRIRDIKFQQGIWFDYVDYQITLEADAVVGEDEFTDPIQNPENNWTIEQNDDLQTFRITHVVGAEGKSIYTPVGNLTHEPWQNAVFG
jgi:hypothetical protein